jgi:hypothetical protein
VREVTPLGVSMAYRVINQTTGELRAELSDRLLAITYADQLASGTNFKEKFVVVESVIIYETPIIKEN